MTPAAVFFDLDDTLLDDTGAKRAYLPQLFVAWRHRLPHCDESTFDEAWSTALDLHFEPFARADFGGKIGDGFRIVHVAAKGRVGHEEVIVHQP